MGKKLGLGCLVIIGILVVLFIIGAVAGGGKDGAATATKQAAVAPTEATVEEIAAAYEANEAAAQAKYGDRPLLVTGTLTGISLDFMDKPFLQLKSANEFLPANAALVEADHAKAASLTKGTPIKLLCGGVSEVASMPQLSDCAIQ